MNVKRKDFQKIAAVIREFLLKLSEDIEGAELRDALNLALLQMQRYYRVLRSRSTLPSSNSPHNGGGDHMSIVGNSANGSVLSQSLHGLSPMTPFRDELDKFVWRWMDLDAVKVSGLTLPARLDKDSSSLPTVIRCARQGDNTVLAQLIERDGDVVRECDSLGRSALVYSVQFGFLDTLQLLLDNGADVNALANDGSTAVHRACYNGNEEALELLIQYDANLSIQDDMGRAPIHWACLCKSKQCLQLLLKHNVDVSVRDRDGMSAAMWACRVDHFDHFELIGSVISEQRGRGAHRSHGVGMGRGRGEEGGDGLERDHYGRTWMHWSVRRTEPLVCLKTLLTDPSDLARDEDGKTVIHTAAEQGSLPAAKIIVEIAGRGCLDLRDFDNRSPLMLATMGGHGELVNYFLSEGADVSCVDNTGATVWDYARGRQLHYCLLIIASYIHQRAREQQSSPEGGEGGGGGVRDRSQVLERGDSGNYSIANTMTDDFGINNLQINSHSKAVAAGGREHAANPKQYQNAHPHPPPSKPPVTPRTPRTSHKPITASLDSSFSSAPRSATPTSASTNGMKSPSPPQRTSGGTPRGSRTPQKRSPSTPVEEEGDDVEPAEFEQHHETRTENSNVGFTKRIKSEAPAYASHAAVDRDGQSTSSSSHSQQTSIDPPVRQTDRQTNRQTPDRQTGSARPLSSSPTPAAMVKQHRQQQLYNATTVNDNNSNSNKNREYRQGVEEVDYVVGGGDEFEEGGGQEEEGGGEEGIVSMSDVMDVSDFETEVMEDEVVTPGNVPMGRAAAAESGALVGSTPPSPRPPSTPRSGGRGGGGGGGGTLPSANSVHPQVRLTSTQQQQQQQQQHQHQQQLQQRFEPSDRSVLYDQPRGAKNNRQDKKKTNSAELYSAKTVDNYDGDYEEDEPRLTPNNPHRVYDNNSPQPKSPDSLSPLPRSPVRSPRSPDPTGSRAAQLPPAHLTPLSIDSTVKKKKKKTSSPVPPSREPLHDEPTPRRGYVAPIVPPHPVPSSALPPSFPRERSLSPKMRGQSLPSFPADRGGAGGGEATREDNTASRPPVPRERRATGGGDLRGGGGVGFAGGGGRSRNHNNDNSPSDDEMNEMVGHNSRQANRATTLGAGGGGRRGGGEGGSGGVGGTYDQRRSVSLGQQADGRRKGGSYNKPINVSSTVDKQQRPRQQQQAQLPGGGQLPGGIYQKGSQRPSSSSSSARPQLSPTGDSAPWVNRPSPANDQLPPATRH